MSSDNVNHPFPFGQTKTRPVTRSMSRVFATPHATKGALHASSSATSTYQPHHQKRGTAGGSSSTTASSTSPSLSPSSTSLAVASTTGGGLIRCICHGFLLNPNERLLECSACHNWSHLQCVASGEPITPRFVAEFVCQFCAPVVGSSAMKRTRQRTKATQGEANGGVEHVEHTSALVAAKLQPKVVEVPDARPTNAAEYEKLMGAINKIIMERGFSLVEFPETSMSDKDLAECMDCCRTAIEDATFSESYPRYCLREQQLQVHAYVRGCALRHNESNTIVSVVLSNGMDPYGNLKPTIRQLKIHKNKSTLASLIPPQATTATAATSSLEASLKKELDILEEFSEVADTHDFVHYTLVATHEKFRRHSLATLLMSIDMLRWAVRGRTRCFVNMALQKRLEGSKVICFVSAASRNLYHLFGFHDVFPKYERTGEVRWTAKEADAGRVMANLHFIPWVLKVVRDHFGLSAAAALNEETGQEGKGEK